jgi:serine protease
MKLIMNDNIDVSAFDMPDYCANYNEVQGMAQEEPLWNIKDGGPYWIGAEPIWKITNSTPDVVVALVDSGLAAAAIDVFLNVAPGYDFISDPDLALDWDERDMDATDPGNYGPDCPMSSWHSTRLASILAARHNYEVNLGMKGVAQNCTVMLVRVLGECRTGYASDVIVWAARGEIVEVNATETPAKLIMMAFSGYGTCPGYLQSAVIQAINLGAILIAAAGNNAEDASMYFPGNCDSKMVIAASTRQGTLATYSNFGSIVDFAAPGGDWANAIMALGMDQTLAGLNVQMQYGVGTSFSVPHVAGIGALAAHLMNTNKSHQPKIFTSILRQFVFEFESHFQNNSQKFYANNMSDEIFKMDNLYAMLDAT